MSKMFKSFKPTFITLIFIIYFLTSFSQTNITVIDSLTRKPIPNATIKVLHKPLGCYANDKGEFELSIITETDTLLISENGYYKRKIEVSKILASKTISLLPEIISLNEVTISNTYMCRKIEGIIFTNTEYIINVAVTVAFEVSLALNGRVMYEVEGSLCLNDSVLCYRKGYASAEDMLKVR